MTTTTKVNVADAPWQECECGGMTFRSSAMAKKVSALISPDGQEKIVPIDIFVCESCNKVPGFVNKHIPGIPDQLKSVKPINISM